jgi:AraC-like DNA-binding protein
MIAMLEDVRPTANVLARFKISTDAFAPADRFDRWLDAVQKRVVGVDIQAPDKATFRSDLDVLQLANVTYTTRASSPHSVMRTARLLRDGDNSFALTLCADTPMFAKCGDAEAALRPGSCFLFSLAQAGGLRLPTGGRTCSVIFSREVALSMVGAPERIAGRVIKVGDPSISLLRAYLNSLEDLRESVTSSLALLVDQQVRELIAHAINPASDLARSGTYGGIKAARLRTVLETVATNLSNPSLGSEMVGKRLGVSGRYVQQLMESAGYSFGAYAREARLERSRSLLQDPLYALKRIVDIAEMAGFTDLSHFNRDYRQRYGQTPSDTRHGYGFSPPSQAKREPRAARSNGLVVGLSR